MLQILSRRALPAWLSSDLKPSGGQHRPDTRIAAEWENSNPHVRARANVGRTRYNTKRRKDQKDLQDLLVDPLYDPLFDGLDDEPDSAPNKDPFNQSGKGRPKGSARPRFNARQTFGERAQVNTPKEDSDDEDDPLVAYLTRKEEPPPTGPEIMKRYQRWWYLQQQQEQVMELHHKHRATEISNYAQSTALAAVMEKLERADEYSDDPDPLPSWIRAKKLIAENWDKMEQLSGSRKDTLDALNEYAETTAERQHLLDTWDPIIYEGQRDSEERVPDFIDRYLVPKATSVSFRSSEQAESSLMDEILPDMDYLDSDE